MSTTVFRRFSGEAGRQVAAARESLEFDEGTGPSLCDNAIQSSLFALPKAKPEDVMKVAVAVVACLGTALALAQGFDTPKPRKKAEQRSMCEMSPGAGALAMMFDLDAQPLFTTLQPSVTQDGIHVFAFVSQWEEEQLRWNCLTDEQKRDAFVNGSIGRHLAEKQWCLQGWEVTTRKVIETQKPLNLYIEGKCR